MICKHCDSDLIIHHILEDDEIPKMTNGSRIILPKCSICKNQISYTDFTAKINFDKKILLITGTAGAGKTAIGQYIESKSNYIFIDGDAIQKKVNYFARKNSEQKKDYFKDTIETTMILLALGYNVVVGYIINRDTLEYYTDVLQKHGIAPTFRVLVPNRQVCIDRDLKRECWVRVKLL